jgi:DMSO/TMAO reductase YedYZ molybdopterin-dependent catalytic subunit
MIDRRSFIKHSGAAIAALGAGMISPSLRAFAATAALPFDNGERPLVKYPQKRPMIGLTSRPPQLETPFSAFNANVITPNDAFFVRYHLADVPLNIDPDAFSVGIQGKVDKPIKLSLADIKKMPAVDIVAVNQCSGNSRGFFNPRVAGGQLGCAPGHLQRHGRARDRQDSGFRQGARHRPCARRRGHARLFDERR